MVGPTELFAKILEAKRTGQRFIRMSIPTHRLPEAHRLVLGVKLPMAPGVVGIIEGSAKNAMGDDAVVLKFDVAELETALTEALRGEKPKDVMSETEFKVRTGK